MASLIGQQFGSYILTDFLGQGASAQVYVGEHIRLHSRAAIKVLHTRLAEESVEHFLAEARIIARLNHPHIVRVFDFNVENGTPYLVEDYAPNGNLRMRHLMGTILPLDIVVDYTKQIADALQYAHDQKVIHRDVKPQNLLLGQRNQILLSDFGIATISESSRLTSIQDIAGTASYMSPEQFKGLPRRASDQYSLAIVVYEWLSGSCPFRGTITEIASQHLYASPPLLRQLSPLLPQHVEEVISIALAKEPEQRFSSVRSFANALEQASKEVWPPVSSHEETILPAKVVASTYVFTPVTEQDKLSTGSKPTLPVAESKLSSMYLSNKVDIATESPYLTDPPQRVRRPKWKWVVLGGIAIPLILIASLLFVFLGPGFPLFGGSHAELGFSFTGKNHANCMGFSDRFQQKDLGGWTWQDPGSASTYDFNNSSHFLHIFSSGAVDEDLNPNNNTNAPRILQSVSGNFSIETQIDFKQQPASFQGAAILMWINQGQFLRLETSAFNGKYYGVNFVYYNMTDPKNTFQDLGAKLLVTPPTVKLRLQRNGAVFSGAWQQGSGDWHPISKTYTITSGQVQVGLVLMNSAFRHLHKSSAEVSFHYFHFSCL
jgi:serine/threonine protein kinase